MLMNSKKFVMTIEAMVKRKRNGLLTWIILKFCEENDIDTASVRTSYQTNH